MRPPIRRHWLVLLPLPLAVGCASWRASYNEFESKEASEQYVAVDRHSSYPAIRRVNFEQVNLLELIDPHHQSQSAGMSQWSAAATPPGSPAGIPFDYGRWYDLVLAWFRSDANAASPEQKRIHRDGVQDKILAVSTSRCNVFKTFLRRQQTDTNFTFGSLTTVAGVLGAMLPGATASRNLAGTAGIFSGLQAEYNQAYFSNLAAHVIVQGIELRQNRLKHELLDGRKNKFIDEYSMEAAINDAMVIDGNCSALSGLIEAQDSIKEVETPGMRMAARAMTSAKALQELNSKSVTELQSDGRLDKLLSIAGGNVPSLLVTSTQAGASGGAIGVSLTGAANLDAVLRQHIDLQAALLGQSFDGRQKAAGADRSPVDRAKLVDDYKTAALKKLGLDDMTKPGEPFLTCAMQLKKVAGELGTAAAQLSVVRGNEPETKLAAYAVDVAQARARLVLAQASAVRAEAQAQIDASAAGARAGLIAVEPIKDFDDPARAKLTVDNMKPLDPKNLKANCS